MNRRLVAAAATGLAMVLLVLAASSGPVRVWDTPPAAVGPSPINGANPTDTLPPQASALPDRSDGKHWGGFFSQLLEVLVIGLLVTLAALVVRLGMWPRQGQRGLRQGRDGQITALPDVPEREPRVDIGAARAALVGGNPRNAIVACWMQLERGAAAAGLPRGAAETSAEYVELVITASSVDPAPIRELAALYREARFSRHELGDDHRARAFAALDDVEGALRRGVEVRA
jgi:hypothetical protein